MKQNDETENFSTSLDNSITKVTSSLQTSKPIKFSSLSLTTKENEELFTGDISSKSNLQTQTTILNDLSFSSAHQTSETKTTETISKSIVSESETDSFKSSLITSNKITTNEASVYLTSSENFSTTTLNDLSKKKPNNIGTILMGVFIPIACIAFLVFIFIGYKKFKPSIKKEKLTENACIDDTYDVQMELDENFNNPVFTSNDEREI